jgi:hypothetical protein
MQAENGPNGEFPTESDATGAAAAESEMKRMRAQMRGNRPA